MSVDITIHKIGIVRSVRDDLGAERIKVSIVGTDETDKSAESLPWCYPLLPMLVHVKPKEGEKVMVFFSESENIKSDRYYVGPINSQIDKLNGETLTALNGQESNSTAANASPFSYTTTEGCFGENDEVTLYGRKNGELIIGDDYASLRCNARKFINNKTNNEEPDVEFNRINPSYLTLHGGEKMSSANLVADRINLFGNQGSTEAPTSSADGSMMDENKLQDLMGKAHQLPYGDILVEFMQEFVKVFVNHVHVFPGYAPDPSSDVVELEEKANNLTNTALSESVRIN